MSYLPDKPKSLASENSRKYIWHCGEPKWKTDDPTQSAFQVTGAVIPTHCSLR